MLSEADFNKFMAELKNAGKTVAAIERQRFGSFLFWKGNINSLRKEVAKLNLLIQEGAAQPRDKLALLHHEGLIDEANVLRSALQSAVQFVEDAKTKNYLQVAVSWLKTFEENVNKHKILCETNAPGTEEFEKIILYKYETHKERLLMAIDDVIQKEAVLSANVAPDVGRRRVLQYATAGLVAAFTGTAYAQDEKLKVLFGDKQLTEDDVAKLISTYPTVEELLKEKKVLPVPIEFVQYNRKAIASNYDSLVFQKELKPENRRPIMAIFYRNNDDTNIKYESFEVGRRSAILLKLLGTVFPQFKLVAYNMDSDPALAGREFKGFDEKYGVKRAPSMAIYGLTDVTKSNAPKNTVTFIDMVNGGPKTTKSLFDIYNGISKQGIPTNITAPNGKYVWRLNNSFPWNWEKIDY